jgi:hypothetical protein
MITFATTSKKSQIADSASLALFIAEKWQSLYEYGNSTMKEGIDFSSLRMRTGYAAFMLGKYSQSLKYYSKTYLVSARKHPFLKTRYQF